VTHIECITPTFVRVFFDDRAVVCCNMLGRAPQGPWRTSLLADAPVRSEHRAAAAAAWDRYAAEAAAMGPGVRVQVDPPTFLDHLQAVLQ
jgi:hypothetical protein